MPSYASTELARPGPGVFRNPYEKQYIVRVTLDNGHVGLLRRPDEDSALETAEHCMVANLIGGYAISAQVIDPTNTIIAEYEA